MTKDLLPGGCMHGEALQVGGAPSMMGQQMGGWGVYRWAGLGFYYNYENREINFDSMYILFKYQQLFNILYGKRIKQ